MSEITSHDPLSELLTKAARLLPPGYRLRIDCCDNCPPSFCVEKADGPVMYRGPKPATSTVEGYIKSLVGRAVQDRFSELLGGRDETG